MQKRKTTPQEKKVRSYMRQRRNCYGENDKSSRKAIRQRKRWVNRSYRRSARHILRSGNAEWDELDASVDGLKRKEWRKGADMPLVLMLDMPWSDSARTRHRPNRSKLRKEALKRLRKARTGLHTIDYGDEK